MTRKKTVQFDAHKVVNRPTKVAFQTKDGTRVGFVAEKPTEVPVHVKFKAEEKREVVPAGMCLHPLLTGRMEVFRSTTRTQALARRHGVLHDL